MPCKPITLCSSLLSNKKRRRRSALNEVIEPTPLRPGDNNVPRRQGGDGGGARVGQGGKNTQQPQGTTTTTTLGLRRSSSEAQRDFARATAGGGEGVWRGDERLPTCEEAYARFLEMYPRFLETAVVEEVREKEYGHLGEGERGVACMDYCGFGLFSHLQQQERWESSTFGLANVSAANLSSQALFGGAQEGTMEWGMRKRIMEYLSIQETEYSMVFTASRGHTFKLLADAYPFEGSRRLITMYDHESESVGWLIQRAMAKGAKISTALFRWPSLRVCSSLLKKQLLGGGGGARSRKKKLPQGPLPSSHMKGLFVFPVQSRVSGSKYSYQWMSLAQQNKWHVLLDASALGPKDMDSLGLSLFRPDFIIASFYKLFGGDPSGFGCLFIKNSAMQCIQASTDAPVSGMVRIIPFPSQWAFSGSSEGGGSEEAEDGIVELDGGGSFSGRGVIDFEFERASQLSAVVSSFSGPMLAFSKSSTPEHRAYRIHSIDDNDSSVCEEHESASVGGVPRSPVFSEDGTDNLFCIDMAPSTLETASRASISEDVFSEPVRNAMHDEELMNPVVLLSPQHKKDVPTAASSRSRIRDLCSGLLHLHTGRTFPAGDVKELRSSTDGQEDLDLTKHCARWKGTDPEIELLEPRTAPFTEICQQQTSCHGLCSQEGITENGMKEDTSHRVVLLLRKVDSPHKRDQAMQPGAGVENGDVSLSIQERDHGKNDAVIVDVLCKANTGGERGEAPYEEERTCLGSLETIAEMDTEADCCQAHEQDNPGDGISGCDRMKSELEDSASILSADKQKGKETMPWSLRENAICRETEGEFRLLGRRNGDRFSLGRVLSSSLHDDPEAPGDDGGFLSATYNELFEEIRSDDEIVEEEPQLFCTSLDHADALGLNKTNIRLRYLINWLISSLLRLHHPHNDLPLVRIYGPQVRYDRGASVAFNVFDCHGKMLHPELVRMLADQSNISLGLGFLKNIQFSHGRMDEPVPGFFEKNGNGLPNKLVNMPSRIEVVTAALSLLSNFEDVYRTWVFVARLLDPAFVSRELGHNQSPSQAS